MDKVTITVRSGYVRRVDFDLHDRARLDIEVRDKDEHTRTLYRSDGRKSELATTA